MLVGERSVMSGEGRKEVWLGDEDVGREGLLHVICGLYRSPTVTRAFT
jgi:hypothetical protein